MKNELKGLCQHSGKQFSMKRDYNRRSNSTRSQRRVLVHDAREQISSAITELGRGLTTSVYISAMILSVAWGMSRKLITAECVCHTSDRLEIIETEPPVARVYSSDPVCLSTKN